ncbi:MAG: hypothetical protein ACXVX9_00120 [Mycobacteriaceae bacterium]
MGSTRKLGASERALGGFGFKGDKARDRTEARRAIEELNQNDRIIALLGDLVAEQRRTNQLLEWLGTQRGRPSDTGS